MKKEDSKKYIKAAEEKTSTSELIDSFRDYVLERDEKDFDTEYLFSTFYNFMSHLKIFDSIVEDNNNLIRSNMPEKNNPLIISKNDIEEWYRNRDEMSDEEKICFIMLYSNRISKMAHQGISDYLEESINPENKKDYLHSLDRIYKNLIGTREFYEFLRIKEQYKSEEISEEEFLESKGCRAVKWQISNNKKTGLYIDLDDVDTYFVLRAAQEKMYTIKDRGIKELLAHKSDIKIDFATNDRYMNANQSSVNISIPNYSMPFRMHFYKKHLEGLLYKNPVESLLNGEEIKQFPSIWPIKLTKEQIEKISQMKQLSGRGRSIQSYINKNQAPEKKKITKAKGSKGKYTLKEEKDKKFAREAIEQSGIQLGDTLFEELANNSQGTLLSTRWNKMKEFFEEQWSTEGREYEQEELEREVSRAFIYTKLIRGGMQSLDKNLSDIYLKYEAGCRLFEEALEQGKEDIKGYVKERINQPMTKEQQSNDLKQIKINRIIDIAEQIRQLEKEIEGIDSRIEALQKRKEGIQNQIKDYKGQLLE